MKAAPSVKTRAAGTRPVALPKERSGPRRCSGFIFLSGLAQPMPLVGLYVHLFVSPEELCDELGMDCHAVAARGRFHPFSE